MAADGIKIKINCDVRGAEKAMEQLEAQVAKLQKAERRVGHLNTNYQKLGADAQRAYAEAEKALQKYKDAEEKANRRGQFVEQRTLAKNPNASSEDLDRAAAMDSTLYNLSASASAAYERYAQLTAEAEKLAQKHERLGATLRQAQADLGAERQATRGLQDEINRTDFVVDRIKGAFTELGRRIGEALHAGVSRAKEALASLPGAAISVARRAASGFVAGVGKMGKALAGLYKKARSATSRLGLFRKETQKGQNAAQGFGKAIIKLGTMLKLMVIRKALRAIITAAKEGFENLAQYSSECNTNMSALMSSLTRLKNSFATAFSPVLTIVTPALTALIDALSTAITYVGMLFAALSGAKSFTRAAAVTEDYAASLGDAGKAAEDAKKTFSFDKLNQFQGSDNTQSGAGKADPSEMFEEVEIPPWIQNLTDLIKSQDWEGLGAYIAEAINRGLLKLKDLVSWDNVGGALTGVVDGITGTINSLVDNIDWALLGETLGTGVNTLVNTLFLLFTGINWYNIGAALATGLNSMIATIDWYHLGETVGAWFSIAINTALGFVQNFDWAAAGVALGTALQGLVDYIDWDAIGTLIAGGWNGAMAFILIALQTFDWAGAALRLASGANTLVSSVDWAATGETISTFFVSVLTFLYTAIENFDWVQLGEDVKTMLVNIDWGAIFTAMFETMGAIFGGLVGFLWGLIKDAWHQVVQWWNETAFEDGKFTIEGLLDGIVSVISSIGSWIYEHIFQPFINGFKNAFGIHSPSTVMAEMGRFIIEGLKSGLGGLWDKVKSIFTDAIDGIKETFSLDNLKDVGSNAVKGLMNGLKTIGSKAVEWGSGILGNIKDALGIHSPSTETEAVGEYTVAGYINGINAYSPALLSALTDMTNKVIALFKTTGENLLTMQKDSQSKATSSLNSWMATVRGLFTTFYANLTSQTNSWASGLQSTLNSMVAAARSAAASIASALSSARADAAAMSSLGSSSSSSKSTSKSSSSKGKTVSTISKVLSSTSSKLKVPAYATGAVLPANHPHLAIVGDQRRGTNIETQMSTMVAAFKQAFSEMGGAGGDRPLQVNLCLDTGVRLGRALLPSIQEASGARGVSMTVKGV